jgi:hypothetical protein
MKINKEMRIVIDLVILGLQKAKTIKDVNDVYWGFYWDFEQIRCDEMRRISDLNNKAEEV